MTSTLSEWANTLHGLIPVSKLKDTELNLGCSEPL